MILVISDREDAYSMSSYVIPTSRIKDPIYHPYIATADLEKCVIDLTDKLPLGVFSNIMKKMPVVPNVVSEEMLGNARVMQVLCEIYPDESARLRQAFIKDKTKYFELISKIRETYGW